MVLLLRRQPVVRGQSQNRYDVKFRDNLASFLNLTFVPSDFRSLAAPSFISSVYLPGLLHHSVASTTTGQLALFGPHDVSILAKSWEHDRALLKFVQLGSSTEKITSLSTYQDRILVVGFEHGAVALYDFQVNLPVDPYLIIYSAPV
jgi:hypothetical protein